MKERLIAYLLEHHFSVHGFEKYMGWPMSTITQFKKGLRSDKLMELCKVFPNLDMRWLLTGEYTRPMVDEETHNEFEKKVENLESSLELQKKLYDNLWSNYQKLKEENKALKEKAL